MFPLVSFSWKRRRNLGPRVASQMLQRVSKPATEPRLGSKTRYAHLGELLTVMIKGALIGLAFGLRGQKKW